MPVEDAAPVRTGQERDAADESEQEIRFVQIVEVEAPEVDQASALIGEIDPGAGPFRKGPGVGQHLGLRETQSPEKDAVVTVGEVLNDVLPMSRGEDEYVVTGPALEAVVALIPFEDVIIGATVHILDVRDR